MQEQIFKSEERAGEALRSYPGYTGSEEEDITEVVTDMVSDLLHLARSLDVDPGHLLLQAWGHFAAEREGEDSDLYHDSLDALREYLQGGNYGCFYRI